MCHQIGHLQLRALNVHGKGHPKGPSIPCCRIGLLQVGNQQDSSIQNDSNQDASDVGMPKQSVRLTLTLRYDHVKDENGFQPDAPSFGTVCDAKRDL